MIYRNFPHPYLSWVDLEKLSSDLPNLGMTSENFRLIKLSGCFRSRLRQYFEDSGAVSKNLGQIRFLNTSK